MELKMEVYSPTLELLGLLEIQNAVIWERRAFAAGSFSVNSLLTDEAIRLLQPENIIWIAGEDAGIIEYVQEEAGEDGLYLSVKGCDLTGVLSRRILWGLYALNGPVPELMYKLVDDCCINPTRGDVEARKIPGLALSDIPSGGASVRAQKTGGTLLEALEELGEAYQTAFGVRFDPAGPRMVFWARPGADRTIHQTENEPVFYSTELDDVLSSEYVFNAQNYRNIALVAGEGEGSARVHVTVSGGGGDAPAPPAPPVGTRYTVTLGVDPSGSGSVSGGGTYQEGQSVTVTAQPGDGYRFSAWTENGENVSESAAYTFSVSANRTLTAVFAVRQPPRLPAGYTEVQYIESTGNGSISTGITPAKWKAAIYTEWNFSAANQGEQFIMHGQLSRGSYFLRLDGETKISYRFQEEAGGVISRNFSDSVLERDIPIVLDYTAGTVNFDGTAYSMGSSIGAPQNDLVLFSGVLGKLYYCKIYWSGTLVADMVPCSRDSGGVGMYDIIRNQFYEGTNSSFVAGPEV